MANKNVKFLVVLSKLSALWLRRYDITNRATWIGLAWLGLAWLVVITWSKKLENGVCSI